MGLQLADPEKRYEIIIQKLRDNGHKITPQRLAIVKILAKSEGHPSVENIHVQIKKDFPTMSLATVYKNIILIKSLGEVLELGFPDGSNRYDGNKPYPHPHVICVRCQKIIDPDLGTLKGMTAEVANKTGFDILTHRLDFFGVCSDCKIKEKSTKSKRRKYEKMRKRRYDHE
jgi:Fur family peroxide stress response transcriptional regulator